MSKTLTDTQIIERGDLSVRRRIRTELAIVHRVIKTLVAAGYVLVYCDGEERFRNQTEQQGVDTLFSVDCSEIYVYDAGRARIGWVSLVMGNDGSDVVSDYTTSLEEVLKPVFDWITTQENSGRF